jgi:hypothetical protein
MSPAVLKERIAEALPRSKARVAGLLYLVAILTGGVVLIVPGRLVVELIAIACYVAVTALFYDLRR